MPFRKFHMIAVFCPVVLLCLPIALLDSSVQSIVVGHVVLLSCLLPATSLSASDPKLLVVSPLNLGSVF